MNLGGIAAIIAALAFAALVVGILMSISKLPKLLEEVQTTVSRLNTTIDVVTKDVDGLSLEVEALLNKANYLVDDVNGKVGKIDPLFTAVGDLGVTVSEINVSAKDTATNLLSGIGKPKKSKAQKLARNAANLSKVTKFIKPSTTEKVVQGDTPVVENPMSDLERELTALAQRNRSHTAGEITINKGGR
ncbi:TPA: DUF948 domain-containing protein [Streptococcus suis]